MGLAVSQVRLLALTRRKADIELDMQIDAKRKQALTRKATELSQQYYQKLQQSNIQYATSDGYENVNYNYVMGKTDGLVYDLEFMTQVMYGNGDIPQKTCNSMILTDQYGHVVLNNDMADIVTRTKAAYGDLDTENQTAYAIMELINKYSTAKGFESLTNMFTQFETYSSSTNRAADLPPLSNDIIAKMIKNGGYMDGGTVYIVDNGPNGERLYVGSADLAQHVEQIGPQDYIKLQDGYNYSVYTAHGAIADAKTISCMYDESTDSFIPGATKKMMQYLGNLVSYFAPMISSAIKNDMTSTVDITGVKANPNLTANHKDKLQLVVANADKDGYSTTNDAETVAAAAQRILASSKDSYCIIKDKHGDLHVFQNVNGNISRASAGNIQTHVLEDNHKVFTHACDTNNLQNGFQSGVYQLCMVDNMAKGRYHKNTTLDFFIQMSYVSEKMSASKREEITAWYNSEQSKISEQETYWDEEITNLSTELTSVNSEIDSVKTLKSNAIKSVFEWGGN